MADIERTINCSIINTKDGQGSAYMEVDSNPPPEYTGPTTFTPTKQTQTAETGGFKVNSNIRINPIPSEYIVPSGTRTITNNGTFDVKNYASAEVNVSGGGGGGDPVLQNKSKTYTPTKQTQTENVTADAGYDGLNRVSVTVNPIPSQYVVPAGTKNITANGTHNVSGYESAYVDVPTGGDAPELQTKSVTYTPGEGAINDTITPSAGYDGLSSVGVRVNGIPTNYVGSGVPRRDDDDLSGIYDDPYYVVSAPAGYYPNSAEFGLRAVEPGTPAATKGAVSNHSVNVTPTVTNPEGYIEGGTKTGTAVTVSASELVSGSQTITENGTVDVTNLAEVVVAVEGGGGETGTFSIGTATRTLASASSSIQFTGLSGNPTSFVVTSSADIATNTNGVTAVVFDGTGLNGQTMTNQVEADTGFTKSYSGGTLTITATSASFQANAYKLVYTYGGSASDIQTADVQVGSGATSITFPVSGRPAYWSLIFKSDFSTSSGYQRVIAVANDGSSTYGLAMDSQAHYETAWTASYSGGNLTITSQGTNNGGYFHQPGYYQLTYAVDDSAPSYQTKTVTPTTSQQIVTADNGYDALEQVTVNAIPSQYIVPSGNLAITQNGNNINVSNYATVSVNVPSGGGASSVATATVNNSSNTATSISFTGLQGEPIAWCLRCTTSISSSGSTTYYYIINARDNGTNIQGENFRIGSTRQVAAISSGLSATYNNGTLTITSSGSRTTTPGSFYNGTYELVYVY